MRARTVWVATSESLLLVGAVTAAVLTSQAGDWQPWPVPLLLLVLAVGSDFFAIESKRMRISATHFSLVVAMVLLGPAPAVAIGLASTLVDAVRYRPPRLHLLLDLATYSVYPLVGALGLHAAADALGLAPTDAGFLLAVFATFLAMHLLNFLMIVGVHSVLDGESLWQRAKAMYFPVIPAEMAIALLAVGVVAV